MLSAVFDAGRALLQAVREQGREGVGAKRAGSRFEERRSSNWLTIKLRPTTEAPARPERPDRVLFDLDPCWEAVEFGQVVETALPVEALLDGLVLRYVPTTSGGTVCTCSVHSVRPLPGASVSTPRAWEEVEDGLELAALTTDVVLERVAGQAISSPGP